ncbi:hypothetical protein HMPREF0765_0573 [Sphingobacterium spiritivorum ATCC 33300]|uniref:DUF4843 domain-containing protein n=1 Tax=Sphingobacterium spiritivorum ATCC 33300 TaxID=525372 RepID=C2FTB7_SPHSI|nr:hypothetical protein [Sphingobacterium spiritivorum]EEI93841.1 hypothetical protein HMPREF0765_0573 [Sphingobacterium spiritivorum ATCC 33300]QQS98148.1 hypothetical protein I6J03_10755 [Sphingobacterium spiritivorum]
MKNIIKIILLFVSVILVSCEKDYTEFYKDNRPEIPVTFPGATTHGFNPYISVPLSDGKISFTLSIPSSSGRSIKEISKVLGGATSINAGGVRTGTYISQPIAGNGTTVVFSTTIADFRSKSAANNKLVQDFINSATATTLQIAFMYLVTLDNGQEIIPVQSQVWITK